MTHTYISSENHSPWWQDYVSFSLALRTVPGMSKESIHICHMKIRWACECWQPYTLRNKRLKISSLQNKVGPLSIFIIFRNQRPRSKPTDISSLYSPIRPYVPRLQSHWTTSFPPQTPHTFIPLGLCSSSSPIGESLPLTPLSPSHKSKSYPAFKTVHLNHTHHATGIYLAQQDQASQS